MSGLELLDRMKQTHPALPFVVITGAGGVRQAVEAIKRGAFEYVTKPFGADELRRAVASALDGRRHPGEEAARVSQPPPAPTGETGARRHGAGDAIAANRDRPRRTVERARPDHRRERRRQGARRARANP